MLWNNWTNQWSTILSGLSCLADPARRLQRTLARNDERLLKALASGLESESSWSAACLRRGLRTGDESKKWRPAVASRWGENRPGAPLPRVGERSGGGAGSAATRTEGLLGELAYSPGLSI
jgi:hypothetical protein